MRVNCSSFTFHNLAPPSNATSKCFRFAFINNSHKCWTDMLYVTNGARMQISELQPQCQRHNDSVATRFLRHVVLLCSAESPLLSLGAARSVEVPAPITERVGARTPDRQTRLPLLFCFWNPCSQSLLPWNLTFSCLWLLRCRNLDALVSRFAFA